jgi:hypothetical protein
MALQKWVPRNFPSRSVRRGHGCRELLARDGTGHVDIGAMADLRMDRLPGIAMADDGEATQLSFTIRDLGNDGNWMELDSELSQWQYKKRKC